MEDVPVFNALLPVATKPVVLFDTKLAHKVEADEDGRSVRKSDICKDVVPPAFSEVRQYVLPGKL